MYLLLENIFVGLMLGFKSKDLVVGFFREALALVSEVIQLLNFLDSLRDISC